MISIKLICVGKMKEQFYISACAEYVKRMSTMCRIEIIEQTEERERPDALLHEAKRIEEAIPQGAFVIAMCIEGKQLSSDELAEQIERVGVSGLSKIAVIIGSSNGMADTIKGRADLKLSMSKMTFPHHLARVMVLEQLYRALGINAGSKYHK